MRKISFILLILIIGLTACKNAEKKAETPTQMQEVMAVHDSLMPKMSKLANLISELDTKIDTTDASLKYKNAQKDLEASHMAMMDWMKDFGTKFDSDEVLNGKKLTEEKKMLLTKEQKEVEALKHQMENSISKAESLLMQ